MPLDACCLPLFHSSNSFLAVTVLVDKYSGGKTSPLTWMALVEERLERESKTYCLEQENQSKMRWGTVGDEEVVHMVKTWIDHWEDRIRSSELMSEGGTGNIMCMHNRRLARKQENTTGRGGNITKCRSRPG